MKVNSGRFIIATFAILLLSLPATAIDGPPPWDDEHTAWQCIDSTVFNYCEKYERTETGWECTNFGTAASHCEEWDKIGDNWECTEGGYLTEECEYWKEKSNGWECIDSTVFNY